MTSNTDNFETKRFGKPTVIDVRGMIAIGTESGHVVVYGFDQEVKSVLGTEGLGKYLSHDGLHMSLKIHRRCDSGHNQS